MSGCEAQYIGLGVTILIAVISEILPFVSKKYQGILHGLVTVIQESTHSIANTVKNNQTPE